MLDLMLKWIKIMLKWIKKLMCKLLGHWYISNHVGAIRCERCGSPWPIKEKSKMPIHPRDYY